MAVSAVGQVHISVTDLERSVAFYRDVLGLEFLFSVPGQPMAFFNVGGVRLYLGKPEDESFASHPLLYFTTDDIEAEQARLEALGVETIGKPHVVHGDGTTELWMTFLRDPDGHPVAYMQERPQA